MLSHNPYQASSIHLRQYNSIHTSQHDLGLLEVPPPPRATSPDPVARSATNHRTNRDLRLLSDVWLMSAAIFRRLGKIEQAKGAIQEAEVRDEDNPAVWVQVRSIDTPREASGLTPSRTHSSAFITPHWATIIAPRKPSARLSSSTRATFRLLFISAGYTSPRRRLATGRPRKLRWRTWTSQRGCCRI